MSTQAHTALSVLDEILCTAVGVGLVIVALLPGARGMSPVGWVPMWLIAMPALAWWGLHGFALPRRGGEADVDVMQRASQVRRAQPQARRAVRIAARRQEARRAA